MARGNDGNLLQHTVEAEIIAALTAGMDPPSLYLVCTHSMAPFEPIIGNSSNFGSLLSLPLVCMKPTRQTS